MKIDGHEITEQQVDEAVADVAGVGGFKARDLEEALLTVGAPTEAAYRGADRILQRLRKRGHISFDGGHWHFI
ncbi:hypothetical protein ACC782_33540 [Rhizobium ruizarguesonis]